MKAVIQRVKYASVKFDGNLVGACNQGFMILLGVQQGDTEADADKLLKKVPVLRIFEDENGKMNLSVKDIAGEILLVSQFTLYANTSHGNRPSFFDAEKPDRANLLYEQFALALGDYGVPVKKGVFGADMQILQHNDGPVTIVL